MTGREADATLIASMQSAGPARSNHLARFQMSGRTVIARAYPAPAPINDNIRKMSTRNTFKIVCDLDHVYVFRVQQVSFI